MQQQQRQQQQQSVCIYCYLYTDIHIVYIVHPPCRTICIFLYECTYSCNRTTHNTRTTITTRSTITRVQKYTAHIYRTKLFHRHTYRIHTHAHMTQLTHNRDICAIAAAHQDSTTTPCRVRVFEHSEHWVNTERSGWKRGGGFRSFCL